MRELPIEGSIAGIGIQTHRHQLVLLGFFLDDRCLLHALGRRRWRVDKGLDRGHRRR